MRTGRRKRALLAALMGFLLLFSSGKAVRAEDGHIYLYGEEHDVAQFLEEELALWQGYYQTGMRHLFVELPAYTARYLNQWMQEDDDRILDALYGDWTGTAVHSPQVKDFYRQIKASCPETVFHGTDVGHQYDSTGSRYLRMLEETGADEAETAEIRDAIEQGETYYRLPEKEAEVYRENTMAENFQREYEKLNGASVMGVYGAAHTDVNALDWSGQVPCMAAQLYRLYGDRLHAQRLERKPLRTETISVGSRSYQASWFGEQDLRETLDGSYLSREFWRLENAYPDFSDTKLLGDVLPADNYPMTIREGQVFLIDYHMADGSLRRCYYRCDGTQWKGRLATLLCEAPDR